MPFAAAVNRKKHTKAKVWLREAGGGARKAGRTFPLLLPGWANRDPGESGINRGNKKRPRTRGPDASLEVWLPLHSHPGGLVTFGFCSCTEPAPENKAIRRHQRRQSQGADVLRAVKPPPTELANPTLLKMAALFTLIQDLRDCQCILGGITVCAFVKIQLVTS